MRLTAGGPVAGLARSRARGGLFLVVLSLLGVLSGGSAAAEEPRAHVVDPARSQIRFHASSRLMDADGSFHRFGGEVRFDEGRPEAVSARVTVEVASIDTGIRMRDDHLRSEDFFHVERHPTATFVVATVSRDGERWVVIGQLTIRGVTRPLSLPATVSRADAELRIRGEFTVNRQAFGITYRSFLNPIRDEVRVWFDLVASPG